jgi:putative oxidoreductase
MDSDRIAAEFFLNRTSGQFALAGGIIRAVSGLIFSYFGVTKLADLSGTTAQFYAMGLPNSSTIPFLVAMLETFGGLLLIVGLGTRLAAGLLALDMVGACLATLHIIAGRTGFLLLPAFMLVLMLFVLWAGPSAYAMDDRLAGWLATRFGLATGAEVTEAPPRRNHRSPGTAATPKHPSDAAPRNQPAPDGPRNQSRSEAPRSRPAPEQSRNQPSADPPRVRPSRIGRVTSDPIDPPTQSHRRAR